MLGTDSTPGGRLVRSLFSLLHWPRRSLTARLCLVLGSAALIAALLQSVLVGTLARRQVESDIGGRLLDLSAHVTGILDRSMFERYREIEILATLAPFRDPATPRAELRAMLETLQRSYREYAWIGVTDAEGTVIASTGQLLEGERVAERPWYQGAQAGTFVGLSLIHI